MCDNCGICQTCDLKRSHKAINILGDSENPSDMAPTYKLTYFDIRGLAEPIRFLLSYGGIDYEDVRLKSDDWPQIKADMPFGQVPVLEVNGKKIHQSVAITRYLAKQLKLAGDNDLQDLEIDAVVDTINDLRQKIAQFHYETDAAAKEKRKETLYKETLPFYLERLDAIAKANNGHLAAGKLTWADLLFVGLLDTLNHYSKWNLTENHSNLRKVKDNVLAIPAIKTWVEKRPHSDF